MLTSSPPNSPSYIVDLSALRNNLEQLQSIKTLSGAKIVLALKGFSLWHCFSLIDQYLDGYCASGLWEARLASEKGSGHTLSYSPAYKDSDIEKLCAISNHLDFNSPSQWSRYQKQILNHPRYQCSELQCGIRINPEHSTSDNPIYDACANGSRLGATAGSLKNMNWEGISGIHFHTLCEQGSEDLRSTLKIIESSFGDILRRPEIRWMNFGGGHWITKPNYNKELLCQLIIETKERYQLDNVWLEPGEAIAIHTGRLSSSVLDIVKNGDVSTAILDVSATAHMPDVLEMPYKPDVIAPNGKLSSSTGSYLYRLASNTCLAGDIVGDYLFEDPLQIGDTLYFDDMSHYTMVKTSMFNGIPHPSITLKHESGKYETVRHFHYSDFVARMG